MIRKCRCWIIDVIYYPIKKVMIKNWVWFQYVCYAFFNICTRSKRVTDTIFLIFKCFILVHLAQIVCHQIITNIGYNHIYLAFLICKLHLKYERIWLEYEINRFNTYKNDCKIFKITLQVYFDKLWNPNKFN